MTDTVSYDAFVAPIVAAVQSKAKSTASLSAAEIKAVIAVNFRIAVNRVADDTNGYIKVIPVTLYKGVKDYTLPIPDGYQALRPKRIELVNAQWPTGACVEEDLLKLPCCAEQTVEHAYDIHMSVTPDVISDQCEFDKKFVNHYYQAILAQLMYLLSMQPARQWSSLGLADRLDRNYKAAVKRHRNDHGPHVIKTKSERLTDHANHAPTPTNSRC